jgi:hypothetical protein
LLQKAFKPIPARANRLAVCRLAEPAATDHDSLIGANWEVFAAIGLIKKP